MPSRKDLVLVVDDDMRILRMMEMTLEAEGYRVVRASDGEAALDVFCQENPDLVLLDIMLPGIEGFTVCQRIREFSQVPIIMVTAKTGDEEKVQGLDTGADDYITKPFSAKEMAARVRAVLRRTKLWDERPEPAFRLGEFVVDFASHKVTLNEKEIVLTATEYRLLSYLARNAGKTVTPDNILKNVWGEEYIGEIPLVYVSMTRLRKKLLGDAGSSGYILTRPGIGYTMVKEDITK